MKRNFGRILSRGFHRGLKIVSISVLGSLVVFCSPQALCHVMAAGPVRFTTYLMIDENGEFATDASGEYIQLFDEKGNLLAYNEDVKEFLKTHADDSGSNLSAREKVFYLIDGKMYHDDSGSNELTDLSEVMPSIFKYGTINDGYTLGTGNGTVYISPLFVNGNPVYVARVAGAYEKLPAFTISSDGEIGYFERGSVSNGDKEIAFVYDSNYFYDENLNQLENMDGLVPASGDENAPMFAGYYITNGNDRRQFIDIDGTIVLSAGEYREIARGGATEAEYCYVISLNADGADTKHIYSDVKDGSLYNDYQRTTGFDNIGDDMLWQLSYSCNHARGHFAGYYASGDEEGSFTRFIDDNGYICGESGGNGNKEFNARFYHVLTTDDGASVNLSNGKVYSDTELTNVISNIADVTGGIPADSEEEVHSDEKDMDGISKRYFIGYYFASDFWEDDGEGDSEREILLSEYEEEGFDPANVEINKIKFADRDGNIVFNPDDAPDITGDMTVYQNWYTVTVWDDGEVEIEDKADEVKKDKDTSVSEDEEVIEGEDQTEENPDESELNKDGQDGEETEKSPTEEDKQPTGDDTSIDQGGDTPAAVNPGNETSETSEGKADPDGDNEGVEENAKPLDKDQSEDDGSDSGDGDGNGDGDSGSGDNSGNGGESNVDVIIPDPVTQDEGEGN